MPHVSGPKSPARVLVKSSLPTTTPIGSLARTGHSLQIASSKLEASALTSTERTISRVNCHNHLRASKRE
jgi:hypothetical protein